MDEVIDSIYENAEHFINYLTYRIDIISSNPNRWLNNSKRELPTFEYYLKNCVENKDSNYDFTVRRYGNQSYTKEFNFNNSCAKKTVKISVEVKHSMWMGTPFNYETIIKKLSK